MADDFFSSFNQVHGDEGRTPAPKQEQESSQLLQGLNPEQRKAVLHDEGPLLILAGAGSGKTRVITHRIAYLVQVRGISPWSILAITFTNKAANEMKSRVADLIGPVSLNMWVGTFHSMFARILRRHAELIGYSSSYTILDTTDQRSLAKACCQELDLDSRQYNPNAIHSAISDAKNRLKTPEQYAAEAGHDVFRKAVAKVYALYQRKLRQNDAMDFDDILMYTVRLLHEQPEVLRQYQERFRYIMVDEYQDTNGAQYEIIRLLAAGHHNICVVGDDDQSIYSFRGANIENILNFEKDYKNCTVIKLEQNYRSTSTILEAANAVISNNQGRKAKKLRTDHGEGEKITVFSAQDHIEEARYIADEIERQRRGGAQYSDMAILYRNNAISRSLEQGLRERAVPYKIFGGVRFYDRKEIKDVIAYLRLATLPHDDISFMRVVNTPRRGIGEVTVQQVQAVAAQEQTSMLQVCRQADRYPDLSRAAIKLMGFSRLIDRISGTIQANELSFAEFIEYVEEESGLLEEAAAASERDKDLAIDRVENLKELISDALDFVKNYRVPTLDEVGDGPLTESFEVELRLPGDEELTLHDYLIGFLDHVALYSDLDTTTDDEDYVRLMTIHSAKGLEFNILFVTAVEEGIFPSYRSISSQPELEEERRLCYVAITRAKVKLYLTTAGLRMLYGRTSGNMPSRFINEIPEHLVEQLGSQRGRGGLSPRLSSGDYHETAYQTGKTQPRTRVRSSLSSAAQPAGARQQKNNLDVQSIRKGDRLRHATFGACTVLAAEAVAGDSLLHLQFDSGQEKHLLAQSAPLTKLDK